MGARASRDLSAQLEKLGGWHPRVYFCAELPLPQPQLICFFIEQAHRDAAAARLLVVSPVCGKKLHVSRWALPVLEASVDEFTSPEVTHLLGSDSLQPFVQEVLGNGHFQGTVHLVCSTSLRGR